jgi:hypothetical protein
MLQPQAPNTIVTANPQSSPPTPGIYPGPGKAVLLRPGMSTFLFQNNLITAGQSSIAVQLERTKSGFFYPIGFSVEVSFSGAPGTFEVDVQTSDTDQDSFYVLNTKITTGLNASNVGRLEVLSYWALFARISVPTLQNAVNVTAKITR